jgi:hypothetical protein
MAFFWLSAWVAALFGAAIGMGVWSAMKGKAVDAALLFGAVGFMLHISLWMGGR